MKKATFTVPVWALSYLCNRDKSGLTLGELQMCQHFERQNKVVEFLDTVGEEFFARKNDFSDHLAGNCVAAVFSVRYTSDELFSRIVCRVDGKYGAPIGRQNSEDTFGGKGWNAIWARLPFFDRRVHLDSGGCYPLIFQFYDHGT